LERKFCTYQQLGIPDGVSQILVIICIILLLIAYAGGTDLGIFNIPQTSNKIAFTLKFVGPIAFFLPITNYYRFWSKAADVAKID